MKNSSPLICLLASRHKFLSNDIVMVAGEVNLKRGPNSDGPGYRDLWKSYSSGFMATVEPGVAK